MDGETGKGPAPAALMRRMTSSVPVERVAVSCDGSAPLLRCAVEAGRGGLTIELGPPPEGEHEIQWTQNGVPIAGQTAGALRLAALTADDSDVYFATVRSAAGTQRSQAVLVVVVPGSPLLNVSARGRVTAEQPLIMGFAIGRVPGRVANKRYLLRVVGGSLRRFGVAGTAGRPRATLHRGRAVFRELVRSTEEAAQAREWAERVGAFALDEAADELVAVLVLPAGGYSLVVIGGEGAAGEVLAEVYELPE